MDWWLIISSVLITGFGLVGIYSTSLAKNDYSNFEKQLAFFAIGLGLMVVISLFDYRLLRNNSYLILALYSICILLLVGLHFFAPVIRGARGWYKIGFLTLAPIEPVKIILLILLAKYFSVRHVEMYKFRHIVFSGLYALLPAALIFIKPDLGTALVLIFMWIGILIVSGIKLKHFAILSLGFVIVAAFSWNFLLKDYQKERVTAFLFPSDILGSSWSQTQTKLAIGSGQISGEGIGKDSQVQYGFLPEPHTDFIFSAIAEEWGVIGIFVLFVLYGVLIWRITIIAVQSQSNFPRLFAVGFAILLIAQFAINVGMNLSLLPVVGIYLPFVSYGGSGLIANFISLGILQSIKLRNT